MKTRLIILWLCCFGSAIAADLTAAGATFPYPIYEKWFDSFSARNPGVHIQYQAVGSEEGIRRLLNGSVDFAASDVPLTDQQIAGFHNGVLHFPSVLGAVVPIYNLSSVPRDLRFTPEALAGIFMGRIRKWNDPVLRAANKGLRLPDSEIVVVHRSDGSGTTFVFTDYLSKISPEWARAVGLGTTVNWPVGVAAERNEGVAELVGRTANSIGYTEFIYAVENHLAYGSVRNAAGKFVQADLVTIPKAAANNVANDFRISITNAAAPDAYPIATFTYWLVPAQVADSSKKEAIAAFLEWMLASGQRQAGALGFVALPESLVAKERQAIANIHTESAR
jgi:phosphate transport system substrate-binding protein